jgi:hypothetical protein
MQIPVPAIGDQVLIPETQYSFVVTRRTRKDNGDVFLWDLEVPHSLESCVAISKEQHEKLLSLSVAAPMPDTGWTPATGEIVFKRFAIVNGEKRTVHGWVGEIVAIEGDRLEVVTFPERFEPNPPSVYWAIEDCVPKGK